MKSDKFTKYGIEGDKYAGSEKIFDNGTTYPEMKCFIPEGIQLPSGVRNVTSCKYETLLIQIINCNCEYFRNYIQYFQKIPWENIFNACKIYLYRFVLLLR